MIEENKDCPFQQSCNHIDCDRFCLKNYKTSYYFSNAYINGEYRFKKPLYIDDDNSDRLVFTKLAEIEKNIDEYVEKGKNIYIYSSRVGNGKAQPDDALIMTPNGYVTMGDIQEGDEIFGQDGKIYKVLGKFDRGMRNVYELSFNDNTSAQSCDEHIWRIRKGGGKYKDIELKEIINKPMRTDRWLYHIPVTSNLEFCRREIKINPYVLGYLIGNGHLSEDGVSFTTIDEDVVEMIRNNLPKECYLSDCKRLVYRIVGVGCGMTNNVRNSIKTYLREYGLLGKNSYSKFIPKDYLINSYDVRIELLRGLMDSDGFINNPKYSQNNISYSTASKDLSNDIKFLIQSLGGTCTVSQSIKKYTYKGEKKEGRMSYLCYIKLPRGLNPFKCSRKASRFRYNTQAEPYRTIRNIRFVGQKHCYCIMTSNDEGLYLTNDCIVTHNTSWSYRFAINYINKVCFKRDLTCIVLFISVPKLLLELKSNITNKSDYVEHIMANVNDCDLVIWDDIGSKNGTEFEISNLLSIIDNRINNGKSNIYTSNLNQQELHECLGDRLYSRIYNYSECFEIKGKDKRGI